MERSVIIAGFGGQGVMLIGKTLGYAASHASKEATFYPAYGAEMRGGTANCTVVISDESIGSPLKDEISTLIAMNEPSFRRFSSAVVPGGEILINSSLFDTVPVVEGVKVYAVPVNDMAAELGNIQMANNVMLGAYIGVTGVLEPEEVEAIIRKNFASKPAVAEKNIVAFRAGMDAVK
ncbi:MAG: 2-oxoacid:acceptor oxidoreductase family protein [Oscillospiraceae bacterium]|nr:2-oxoacid:acceptor oxidoreductase family protein [Oscillospiraceae bacterium]